MSRFSFQRIASSALLGLSLLLLGCSDPAAPPRELGEVTGTLTIDTKPLANITVIFTPKEGGGASSGLTDENGKFQLQYGSGSRPGALVGTHTVSLRDEGEDPAMPGGDVRIPQKFLPENSTIQKEVTPGAQDIELSLTSK